MLNLEKLTEEQRALLSDEAKLKRLPAKTLAVLLWQVKWASTAREKQRPPEGYWTEWGLLAGRGFGKTRVGAEWLSAEAYFDENAYPSFVIAPTLNDVRHTCFEGPAGLLAILPKEIVKDYNKTNLIITIETANGKDAIIRGFSAEEPERMRGPQCFVAGTMVATPTGEQAIETLKPGELVLTRAGPRRVLATASREAEIGAVTFENGQKLLGTAEHPVYLNRGWTRMDQLRKGDQACALNASNGTASRGIVTATATTSVQTRSSTREHVVSTSTSGPSTTVRSRRAITCIIATKTRATATSAIFNACRAAITVPVICAVGNFPSGTGPKNPTSNYAARSAAPPSCERRSRRGRCAKPARTDRRRIVERRMSVAWNAGACSEHDSAFSAVSVASTWRLSGRQSVYCLMVEEAPEFFANGILVHNCARLWGDELAAWTFGEETWDMAMMGLRLGQHTQAVWTTTPKPKDIVRKLVAPKPGRVITTGSTYENRANMAPSFFDQLTQYEGTQLGRQELDGELIDAEEGGIVSRSSLRLWPAKKPLPPFDLILMSLDTAFTEKTLNKRTHDPDSSACGVFGVFWHEDVRQVMLLDCWAEQLGFPDLIKRVKKEMVVRYGDDQDTSMIKPMFGSGRPGTSGRKPDMLLIEDKGSGISLRQSLEREGVLAHAYNPGRADKLTRLHIVSPIFARGQFWVPESEKFRGKPRTWVEPLIAQLCSYRGPNSIKHDDYVDVCSQALRVLTDKGLLPIAKRKKPGTEEPVHRKPLINPYAV